jgi:hypothetical protein
MKVIIYTLNDPDTEEIRYIGRTKNSLNQRLNIHLWKAKRTQKPNHRESWLKSLLNQNKKPIIQYLTEIEGWSESYKLEQLLINKYINEGYNLVNSHDRGEGGIQRIFTEEHRKKLSDKTKLVHKDLSINHNRVPLKVFDLDGNFINNFRSISECAKFLNISNKHLECSLKRNSKRTLKYQVRKLDQPNPEKYKNPRNYKDKNLKSIVATNTKTNEKLFFKSRKELIEFFNLKSFSSIYYYLDTNRLFKNNYLINDASLKLGELSETPEMDNTEPSINLNDL